MTTQNSSVKDLKYCTYCENSTGKLNVTRVIRYICYKHEICCNRGNGCCPSHTKRYYESWCFWLSAITMVLGCYLLCWYWKKMEKQRQRERMTVDNEGNPPGALSATLRTVDAASVDHLLETLILSYRNRLYSDQNQPIQNMDETKILDNADLPPKYVEALSMPKPDDPILLNNPLPEFGNNDNQATVSPNENLENQDEGNFVIIDLLVDEDEVPSYEEAIKKK